jgi:hypothetical protein
MPTAAAPVIPGDTDGGREALGGATLLYDMGGGAMVVGGTKATCWGWGEVAPYDERFPAPGINPAVLSPDFSTSAAAGAISLCLANAPVVQVARFICLFLMDFLRTKKRTTAIRAMTRMVTTAAMAPPDMPLDEPDEVLALDAALEGVAVAATVLPLLVVVGVLVGNVMEGVAVVDVVVVVVDNDVEADAPESEVTESFPLSVVDSAADESEVWRGRKAGSVLELPSVAVSVGEPVSTESEGGGTSSSMIKGS